MKKNERTVQPNETETYRLDFDKQDKISVQGLELESTRCEILSVILDGKRLPDQAPVPVGGRFNFSRPHLAERFLDITFVNRTDRPAPVWEPQVRSSAAR